MSRAQVSKCGVAVALWLVSCLVAAAEPVVTDSKLNLRAGPGAAFNVVTILPAGAKLDVQRCSKTWCRVTFDRRAGYVSRSVLHPEAGSYASAAPAPVAVEPPKPVYSAAHISRWRDPEWRDQHWRRIEWRNRLRR